MLSSWPFEPLGALRAFTFLLATFHAEEHEHKHRNASLTALGISFDIGISGRQLGWFLCDLLNTRAIGRSRIPFLLADLFSKRQSLGRLLVSFHLGTELNKDFMDFLALNVKRFRLPGSGLALNSRTFSSKISITSPGNAGQTTAAAPFFLSKIFLGLLKTFKRLFGTKIQTWLKVKKVGQTCSEAFDAFELYLTIVDPSQFIFLSEVVLEHTKTRVYASAAPARPPTTMHFDSFIPSLTSKSSLCFSPNCLKESERDENSDQPPMTNQELFVPRRVRAQVLEGRGLRLAQLLTWKD